MSRASQKRKKQAIRARQRTPDPPDDTWDTVFWMPKKNVVPARDWLLTVPKPVKDMMVAILDSVRDAPPPSFPASNLWHVMSDDMAGIFEARDEHDSTLYRLFCILDRDAVNRGLPRPVIAVLFGAEKPDNTKMPQSVYDEVKKARDAYVASNPRDYLPPPGTPAAVR